MGFAALLLEHRRARGLSQEELARVTGMSVRAISDLERGRTRQPRRRTLDALATALALTGIAREEFVAPVAEPAGQRPMRRVPAQLPRMLGDFLGRATEIDQLSTLLTQRDCVPVGVVTGPGGIGKTALAVCTAHRISPLFPDGQLYVDLHGMGDPPSRAVDVLGRLLRDLGVAPERIPADVEERAAALRTLLAGRQVLLVLDDAADAAQVRPLLPGSAGCAVLVTSRRTLAGLEGGVPLVLAGLPDTDAKALFTSLVGGRRTAAEPEAMAAVLSACAGLPLAIRIAGAKLAARPAWSVSWLAAQLADRAGRLPVLTADDLAVPATFQLGYDHLPAGDDPACAPARVFRMLALPDGPTIGLAAVAALLDRPAPAAERALDVLVDNHMLESPAPGRYRCHDLLREFAAGRLAGEPAAERDAATRRLLHWYLHTTHAAHLVLEPRRDPLRLGSPRGGQPPLEFADHAAGMRWYDEEFANLVAAVRQADQLDEPELAWQLAYTLAGYFLLREPMQEWIGTHRVALAAARRTGDPQAVGQTLNDLATGYHRALLFEDAVEAYTEALDLARQLGSDVGAATVLNNLALAERRLGRFTDAITHHEQAVALAGRLADPYGLCVATTNLGTAYAAVRRFDEAIARQREALRFAAAIGGHGRRYQTASVLRELGEVYARLADHRRAAECYRRSGELAGEVGAMRVRVRAAIGLAAAQHALGADADAVRAARTARQLARLLGDPELLAQADASGPVC
jgi:transcriptional regulator with XRE-family HTH domain/tetratricopeptide (TPR) repeat protein